MQKKISLPLAVILILLAVLVTFLATFTGLSQYDKARFTEIIESYRGSDEYLDKLKEVKSYFDTQYIGELDEDEISDYIVHGYVAGTGDKYAAYYNKEEYAEMMEDLNGELEGIGVSVIYNADEAAIEIINVFPDSPAHDAGVQVGDLIKYVGDDYESVASLGYNMAVSKVKGEAGTVARFIAYRGENNSEEIKFEIVRAHVVEQVVTYRLHSADSTVGIIKISSFDTATVKQFNEAITALRDMGAEKLVFDVRNNPGGELNTICSILDTLLPEGPVIRAVDVSGTEQVLYRSDANELDMPMAVLVNSGTASAAELFTSALNDYEKATVVGTLTYGKGCMQTFYPLSDGGAIKLTSAMYYPPFSDNYDGVGITPDVEVELSATAKAKNIYKLTDDEDDQLKAAVASFSE